MKPEILNLLSAAKNVPDVRKIIESRDEVLGRFSPIFQPGTVDVLKKETFREFLSFQNNKHWTGLERQPELYADMDMLRKALSVLVDETRPLPERVDAASKVPGMGPAKFSAILLVAYPSKYGVWNGTSEVALKHFGLWPDMPRGSAFGGKYVAINNVLVSLAAEMEISLWALDSLFWGVDLKEINSATPNNGQKSAGNKGNPLTSREKSIWEIKNSVLETVKNSNGQKNQTIIKNKELLMSEAQLEACIKKLLDEGGHCCAITGLPFEFVGDGENTNMRPSLDRIDSGGQYEGSNVQLVCRFINFWKMATPDDEFRSLIQLVRGAKSDADGSGLG